MRTRLLSFELLEGVLSQTDGQDSDNRRDLARARQVLRLALARELTDRQRECVQLYYFQGRTQEQIAQKLGLNRSTVCRHLEKARARLERAVSYTLPGFAE